MKRIALKRIVSISLIFIAISVMVSVSAMPHHHHGAVACMSNHLCDEANCDKHHGDNSEKSEDHSSCIAETEFTDKYERENDNCDCSSDFHIHLYALLTLFGDIVVEDILEVNSDYGEYVVNYKSVDRFTIGGLRAPPASVC